ncbi:hypothetical protein [Xanthomonas vesicatoria]|uniref:Uncharacterized protein n=1 Tax=Xanthomonas vesicatoria ATCC 35937 TaxID=925775 RepID=F0B7P7_9XANT|nr:hypothetical protein [Xanthomonas vesicatoria]APP75484.1 hypothetical protein BJD12_09715 [Xanthomonas vesicatoria ATCC 35937]EGD11583.1 hypothetical protein XVE_0091 [Xanthomonas vesicatoria ATCC 35937]KTF33835.1 hypothetical protein LMG920_08240 [Xanthomonas vesicatoria]KTF37201.1 hypothetical protein LMG919_08300 [Xanthomonas vesicatoria]MCC8559446.1 hypothetical protein [Xanthomonas vesicatoria]
MFTLLLVVIAIEGVLSITWNRMYFGWGLPVFRRRIPASRQALDCFSLAQVEHALDRSRWPELRFHPLSEHVYAFRETFLVIVGPVYPPIMRGRIAVDRRQREITITGSCNWTMVYIVIGILLPAAIIKPGVTLMFVALLMVVYLLQRRRFISVETAVQTLLQTNTTPLIPRVPDTPRRASPE